MPWVQPLFDRPRMADSTNGWSEKPGKKNKNLLMHHSFHLFSLTGHWVYNGIHHFQALKRTQRPLCYQPIMWPGMAGHRHLPSRKQTCLAGTYTIKILSRWFSHANLWFSSQPCSNRVNPFFPGRSILLYSSITMFMVCWLHYENILSCFNQHGLVFWLLIVKSCV